MTRIINKLRIILSTILLVTGTLWQAQAATVTYTYDSLNRVTSVDYGDGATEDYTYDAAGNRLTIMVKLQVDYYCDNDSDGYYDSSVDGTCSGVNCPPAGCQAMQGNDCNDSDSAIHPGAIELCDNKDNDCNSGTTDGSGESWYGNPTACGQGNCYNTGNLICTGGMQVNTCTPLIPGTEGPYGNATCSDTQDNDCDGLTDTADPNCQLPCTDNDGDGYGNPGNASCLNGSATDCNDNNPVINPGVSDNNCNGVDENCNGTSDENYTPTSTSCGIGICASTGQWICNAGTLVNTCTPGTPQTEGPYGNATCSDTLDNDCDGLTDIADHDCGGESGGTINLPKTGQTTCYDSLGNVVACSGTGQDGEIQAGVAWPDPRFTVGTGSEADCITDNLTGLMWPINGNLPNGTRLWNTAIDFANDLTLCGYSDWRLPNVNELESLVNADVSTTSAWLNTQGFTNVQAGYYWSSTTYANDTSSAWVVGMLNEYVTYYYKSNYYYVLPVRSGPSGTIQLPKTGQTVSYYQGDDGEIQAGVSCPNPRFTIGTGAETKCVTDKLTGLMWTKDANFPDGTRTWQGALDYVAYINSSVGLCGYTDWRLPNRKELRSLSDYSNYNPLLPAGHPFTNVQLYYYWSSTTTAWITNDAWIVDMGGGYVVSHGKGSNNNIWPVRGGLCVDNDSDGYGNPGSTLCPNGSATDCNDNDPAVNPGATGVCDNQDNDCNSGTPDGSGDIWYGSACDGPDMDLCNEGIYQCTSGSQTCSDTTGDNVEVCDGIDNNCDGQTDEGGVCGVPDLLVSTWTAPANACAGATISIKDTTKNQGTGTAGASITKFYFSTNTTLDAGDTPLGSRAVPSLNPAAISTGTTSVTLPNVSIGKYYLIAMADDGKVVTESNETNNKKSKAIYIGPDLIVSALTAPTSAARGTTISIGDTTKNKGCGAAGASTTKFYLSTNTTINIGVDYELGTRPVPALGTNAISPGTTNVTIPSGIITGKYYIIANSDDTKVVAEGNETNNKKTKAITINP